MKITLAYLPEDEAEAASAVAELRRLYPRVKIRKSEANPPYKHIYLTTKKPANP